jgi:hypothetical protein
MAALESALMAVDEKSHSGPAAGTDSRAISPTLSLVTGFPDDRREPLAPHHERYAMALELRRIQDRLDDREHRAAFRIAVADWPRLRRAPKLLETQVQYAAMMLARGFGPDRIADVLGVTRNTLSKRRILRLAETWRHEVLGWTDGGQVRSQLPVVPELEGSTRYPRVIEGHVKMSLLTWLDPEVPIGDVYVNLPPECRPPAVARKEREYLARYAALAGVELSARAA